MSVSKFAYDPKKCDDQICCGDCEFCELAYDDEEEEDDGQ